MKTEYKGFEALDPFFAVVMKGLKGIVDGEHYFDAFADGQSSSPAIVSPDRQIVRWKDYMDSFAAWTASNGSDES